MRIDAAGQTVAGITATGGSPLEDLAAVLDLTSEGVLITDRNLSLTTVNQAARALLGIPPDGATARLPAELVAITRSGRHEHVEELLTVRYPRPCILQVRARPWHHERVLVTLADVSEAHLARKVRREFVAHASHELKSPVAGIQALASAVIQAIEDDPGTAAGFTQRLLDEAVRLGRLVNDLLDLSKLDDLSTLRHEVVDVSAVARHELEQARQLAETKSVRLDHDVAPRVSVLGDAQQLGLLLRNLLDNAIRYTPEDGSVRLELRQTDDHCVVQVWDTGIGIPLAAQPRIFERFYRVDYARSRDRGGTGLGLAIVKHAAELHGGTVRVESEVGNGSVFTFRLPLAHARATEQD